MKILAIDPGPEVSGWCVYDTDRRAVLRSGTGTDNRVLLYLIMDVAEGRELIDGITFDALAIEDIEYQGRKAGASTFITCKWIGKFGQAWYKLGKVDREAHEIKRGDIKTVMCGGHSYTDPETKRQRAVDDPEIRAAVIGRHEPTGGGARPQIGTKKEPGPLYGVAGHAWDAVAVAVVFWEICK
jgi:hypothetical protein